MSRPAPSADAGLVRPEPGVDYTRVLAGVGQRPTDALVGLVAIAIWYVLLNPLITSVIVGVGWLLRRRPMAYADFSSAALNYQYPDGLAAGFVALAVFVPLAFALVRIVHRRDAAWLSSVRPGARWRYLIAVAGVAAVVMNVVYWVTSGRTDFHWGPQNNTWLWLGVVVVLAPLQAAGEEYLFRGYLMQVIGAVVRQKWVVVVVSALVFTAMHGTQNLPLLLDRFAFGALMGALVVLTGGLEASIAAHAVNNLFAFGYAVLSGSVADALSITEVSWAAAGANVLAYAVVAVGAWGVARAMGLATLTPPAPGGPAQSQKPTSKPTLGNQSAGGGSRKPAARTPKARPGRTPGTA